MATDNTAWDEDDYYQRYLKETHKSIQQQQKELEIAQEAAKLESKRMNDFVKTKSITFTVGGTTLTLSKTEARMLRDALNKFVDAFDTPRLMDWENAQTPPQGRIYGSGKTVFGDTNYGTVTVSSKTDSSFSTD